MIRSKFSVFSVIAALILVGGSVVGSTAEVPSTVLINANVIDCTGAPVQENMTVVITGNSIASILANEFTEADTDIYLASLVELGLVLFAITFVIIGLAQLWMRRMVGTGKKG